MKRIHSIGLAIAAAGAVAGGAIAAGGPIPLRSPAEALAGKAAEPPVSCVRLRDIRGHETLADGAILFRSRATVDYVNVPRASCPEINKLRTVSWRGITGNVCTGDIIVVRDRDTGVERGTCALGDFTPFRRPR